MLGRALSLSTVALVVALAALPARAQDATLTVFAAASMKNAVDDINAAFAKDTRRVVFSCVFYPVLYMAQTKTAFVFF